MSRNMRAKTPRALADILNFSGGAAALVAQIRSQSALLVLVKRELETPTSEHLVAAMMHDKQLVLYADSSAWASRFRFGSRKLRGHLISKGLVIEKITIRIALPAGIRRASMPFERHMSRENANLIETTAETIRDPGLSQALKRLSRLAR